MSFELTMLRSLVEKGPAVRVVVAGTKGSVPRDVGASMLVTETDVFGTIGGGALEFDAIKQARSLRKDRLDHLPLGPALGQCCGGLVTVLSEIWDAKRLADIDGDVVARPLPKESTLAPLSLQRLLTDARGEGRLPKPGIVDGWMIEPVSKPARDIWV